MVRYYCDKCGKESPRLESANGPGYKDENGIFYRGHSIEVCSICKAELGRVSVVAQSLHNAIYRKAFNFSDSTEAVVLCELAAQEAIEAVAKFMEHRKGESNGTIQRC